MQNFDLEATRLALSVGRVLERAGVAGRRGRYCCPCKPGSSSRTLSVFRSGTAWHCHRCHKGGSVIDLVAFLEGLSVGDAIRRCAGLAGMAPTGQAIAKRPADPAAERRRAISAKFREVAATRDVLQRIADDEEQPAEVRITAVVARRKANAFLDAVIAEGAR